MTERVVREEAWGFAEFVLTNAKVAEKGKMACWDIGTSGEVVPGETQTDLIPVGIFEETLTGDGSTKVRVRLFEPKRLFWWANDDTDPVAAADIGSDVYIVDDETVSISSATNTRSKAGRAWAVSSTYGVLVEMVPTNGAASV